VAFAGNDTLVCKDESIELAGQAQFYDTVEWQTAGDGVFSDASQLNATYTPGLQDIANGSVTLTLNVAATEVCTGTASDAVLLTVDDCTSIDENEKQAQVKILPNPSNGIFMIEMYSSSQSKLSWSLLDAQGKMVKKGSLKSGNVNSTSHQFNFSELPSGTYYLEIKDGNNRFSELILIQ